MNESILKKSLSIRLLFTVVLITLISLTQASAATYILSGDDLVGANHVEIDGLYYRVDFVEGTADQIYGLTTGGSFDFTTQAEAAAAAQALADQVFDHQVYRDYGSVQRWERDDYDTLPGRTYGITSNGRGDIITPYVLENSGFRAWSFVNEASSPYLYYADSDFTGSFLSGSISLDSSSGDYVFARWTQVPSPIPVPGSALLLGFGLLGCAALRKKSNL